MTRTLMVAASAALSACVATLPDIVTEGDSTVFRHSTTVPDPGQDQNYVNAQACGAHLNMLRNSAKFRSYARVLTTVAAGSTTAVSGYFAATQADDDPQKAKTAATVALVSGLIAVLAQAIPDPSEALDKYREANTSWAEARRLANANKDDPTIFVNLDNCRRDRAPTQTAPTGIGAPL